MCEGRVGEVGASISGLLRLESGLLNFREFWEPTDITLAVYNQP